MKHFYPMTFLACLAAPVHAETWECAVPYDEVNGGGAVTIEDNRLIFVSNWPHRNPETVQCVRSRARSECMSANLAVINNGGASVFVKLYSISWAENGVPAAIAVREPSAIFAAQEDGYETRRVFPALGYTFPVTDCTLN
ncbi:hypothetical protein SAMN05444398_11311 [Roseovarius pacificus]|uniref:Uncharacterized protein n=1 Tax=Roseovarius pacificus TaxID=337701 RepID=A0A1M7HL73_9RHOB|nr:hypothetical protein [Roseovarius pacificus]GGO60689.1 hypothetical protein GCM10011315_35700 [Roseovarius pacificus]SHM29200.1 hypothetical protein SAMN05444398_11311 [Roseovarius pacificus]